MPRSVAHLAVPALAAVLLAACSGAAPSPTPEPTAPAEAKALLRITTVQALPPRNTFNWLPSIVITLDGRVLSAGAVPAIFPGPLLSPIIERQLTPAGWAKVVAEARAAGLLSGVADFTDGRIPPGGQSVRLELVADGREYILTGDPSRIMVCVTTPCIPQPGSPEAFGGFLNNLANLDGWLGADLGRETLHVPAGYAIIVGPPPDQADLPQPVIAWPLAGGVAAFGLPLGDGRSRCGIVTGDAFASIRPALQSANQLTKWRDPVDGSFHGLVVRPLLPGDGNPCEGLV